MTNEHTSFKIDIAGAKIEKGSECKKEIFLIVRGPVQGSCAGQWSERKKEIKRTCVYRQGSHAEGFRKRGPVREGFRKNQ